MKLISLTLGKSDSFPFMQATNFTGFLVCHVLSSGTKGPRRREEKHPTTRCDLSVFGSWFRLAGLKDLKKRGIVKTPNFVLEGNFSAQQMESTLQDS